MITLNAWQTPSIEPEFLNLSQEIPLSMPILDQWLKVNKNQQPFEGVTALFIQHQLGNQVPLVRAMLELGLDPERLFWLDVPYTSNRLVRKKLVDMGIPQGNFICADDDYRVLTAYGPYQRRRVQTIIHSLMERGTDPLLVLDDGAYFLEAASCFEKRFPHVAVVEQTTRGLIKIESNPAMRLYARSVPVIMVADSKPKRILEPPFIARCICAKLLTALQNRFGSGHSSRCLLLGFGTIGSEVARFVSSFLYFEPSSIYVFDPDPKRRETARKRGHSVWQRGDDFNTHFDMVLGCSGRASFTVGDYVYLNDGAVLASASSGSVELSREGFIELSDSSDVDDIEILRENLDEDDIHSDINFRLVDRKAKFLNAGFPVNFDGHVNCAPTRFMQPTATMMVAASVQAVTSQATDLIALDPDFCKWLDHAFREELGEDAQRLLPKAA